MESFKQWKVARHESVIGRQGDLSLIALHEIDSAKNLEPIPGIWEPISPKKPGLMLTANASDQLRIDGNVVEGFVEIVAEETIVELGSGLTAMATSQPGSPHLLAIWDTNCEAIKKFKEIDTYPYDPNWIVRGSFKMNIKNKTLHFTHTHDQSGKARIHQSPGEIILTINGQELSIRPFVSCNHYIVVFNDQTSGHDTYGMGRMLLVTPEEDGFVELNFNHAFLPPCAFSPHFNCPMPPMSNRFPFAIRAGEKNVLLHSYNIKS